MTSPRTLNVERDATITLAYDVLQLGLLLFLTGGLENPFAILMIAPVTVGKGAYVGTGATVREDVPPGALAVSAGKQRNIEGWVEKRAPRKTSKKD